MILCFGGANFKRGPSCAVALIDFALHHRPLAKTHRAIVVDLISQRPPFSSAATGSTVAPPYDLCWRRRARTVSIESSVAANGEAPSAMNTAETAGEYVAAPCAGNVG